MGNVLVGGILGSSRQHVDLPTSAGLYSRVSFGAAKQGSRSEGRKTKDANMQGLHHAHVLEKETRQTWRHYMSNQCSG